MKIVQIDGLKGLVLAFFAGVCAIAGFVGFPGWVAMHLWNKFLVSLLNFPVIDLFQGVLLWLISAIIMYIVFGKQGMPISLNEVHGLSDKEIDMIVNQARVQSELIKSGKFNVKYNPFEISKEELEELAKKDLEEKKENRK